MVRVPDRHDIDWVEPSDPDSPSHDTFGCSDGLRLHNARGKRVCICVVGVGFVGESLLAEFGRVFPCIGFDICRERLQDISPKFARYQHVELTSNAVRIAAATHFLIAVPTLLRSDRSVNLDHVHSALQTVFTYAAAGSTIVIESSVSVGTTRRLLGAYKNVYHGGMSPERVDPGRTDPSPTEIPKIVSGLCPAALQSIREVYGKVFRTIVQVSKPEVAEMTKLFENCYRMVNIAYVNEMSDACRAHGISPNEMINAAATKPYGFQTFRPGLGVGGHCIPINPFYLFANCKSLPVLERATRLMWVRPKKLAKNFHRRCLSDINSRTNRIGMEMPRLLVVGVAFKPGQNVLSCSPGISFARTLSELGCSRLMYHDPLVPQTAVTWMEKLSHQNWTREYLQGNFDGVAICMRQSGIDLSITRQLTNTLVKAFD